MNLKRKFYLVRSRTFYVFIASEKYKIKLTFQRHCAQFIFTFMQNQKNIRENILRFPSMFYFVKQIIKLGGSGSNPIYVEFRTF